MPEVIEQQAVFMGEVPTTYNEAVKWIELCGRVCYKSEDKITPTSAERFVKDKIQRGHLSIIEHSNLVVRVNVLKHHNEVVIGGIYSRLRHRMKFLNACVHNDHVYVGGNLRAWYEICLDESYDDELNLLSQFKLRFGDLFGLPNCERTGGLDTSSVIGPEIPESLNLFSARLITNRGVSHEFVRHRPMSVSQESTRYVRYDGNMQVIAPVWDMDYDDSATDIWNRSMMASEEAYKALRKLDWAPQKAREVLNNALKTEFIVTADIKEWHHIFNLRTSAAAHPQIVQLAKNLKYQFSLAGVI